MIEEAGRISKECTKWGMPLLIMIYPRGEGIDPRSPVAIGHCVRVAEEIGADIIKTSYTGDPETFKKITSACSVPVIVAGGEKGDDIETLKSVRDAVKAGCAGVALGRNSFQRENPKEFIRALCSVVHEDKSPKDALRK